jgi:ribosomal protein S18 acetylase RimI-like enzyme
MNIRPFTPHDRFAIARLLTRIPAFDEEDQALALDLVKIAVNDPNQQDYDFLVAANSGDIPVGYACYGPTPLTLGTFDLYWIAVDPTYTGKGVGSLLLQAVEQAVRERHGRMLLIETSSSQDYARTRHFYLKNGYTLITTIPDFYQPGEDKVTYLKRFPVENPPIIPPYEGGVAEKEVCKDKVR